MTQVPVFARGDSTQKIDAFCIFNRKCWKSSEFLPEARGPWVTCPCPPSLAFPPSSLPITHPAPATGVSCCSLNTELSPASGPLHLLLVCLKAPPDHQYPLLHKPRPSSPLGFTSEGISLDLRWSPHLKSWPPVYFLPGSITLCYLIHECLLVHWLLSLLGCELHEDRNVSPFFPALSSSPSPMLACIS